MPKTTDLIRFAIAAGFAIGLSGYVYLTLHDLAGAVLFAFGLLTIVSYRLKLFTSVAGFIHRNELPQLALILMFNILGCSLVGLLTRAAAHPLNAVAQDIVQERLTNGALNSGLLAIGCGVIMTVSVTLAYRGSWLPLLFGVPIFIKCGFPHCMADAFYISTCSTEFLQQNAGAIALYYPAIVLGNFIGCNLPRLFPKYWEQEDNTH